MSGISTFFKNAFLLFVFSIFLFPAPVLSQEDIKVDIQFKDSRLSVDIQKASLSDVIAELEDLTGIDFRFDSLPGELVNVKFDDLSLRESIERLIPLSTVILLDGDTIASVLMMPDSSNSTSTAETKSSDTEQADNTPSAVISASVSESSSLVEKKVSSSSYSAYPPISDSSSAVARQADDSYVPESSPVVVEQKKSYPGFFTFFNGNSGSTPTTESSPVVTGQSATSSPVVAQQNNTSSSASSASAFSQAGNASSGFAAFGTGFSKAQTSAFAISFPPGNTKTAAPLSAGEVNTIISQAANSLETETMVIAVVDRRGAILGLFRKSAGAVSDQDAAVALARTAAFFSHKQAVLTSRTVRFISGEHFPPNISFTPNGALFGIEHNNRGCDLGVTFNGGGANAFPQSLAFGGGTCNSTTQTGCGLGSLTIPGSFPLYKGNDMVGGVGVFGVGPALANDPQGGLRKLAVGYEAAEFAAVQGAVGFEPPQFSGGGIFIDGIRLPGVVQTARPPGLTAETGGFPGGGTFTINPTAGVVEGSTAVPSGFIVGPNAGGSLTLADVNKIIQQSRDAANRTRAAIRLPFTETARMVIAVGDLNGNILAVFRQSDSTIFSLDVAIAKARNVAYFSGNAVAAQDKVGFPDGTAITNRTISFGALRNFPAGIDFAPPGPFRDVFLNDAANPCSQGRQAVNPNQSGIVFFPGSVPLFKNGVLIGGLGVSGDGVEQDDFVTALGAKGFEPPSGVRADQFFINGVRNGYLKFPRNPTNLGVD